MGEDKPREGLDKLSLDANRENSFRDGLEREDGLLSSTRSRLEVSSALFGLYLKAQIPFPSVAIPPIDTTFTTGGISSCWR